MEAMFLRQENIKIKKFGKQFAKEADVSPKEV